MISKTTTSVKVPEQLNKKIIESVIACGYSMRGKSKWIEEAIHHFIGMPDFIECVDFASEIEALDTTISVRLEKETVKKLDEAALEVRKVHPMMEAVRSNIIRAALFQYLIQQDRRNAETG